MKQPKSNKLVCNSDQNPFHNKLAKNQVDTKIKYIILLKINKKLIFKTFNNKKMKLSKLVNL